MLLKPFSHQIQTLWCQIVTTCSNVNLERVLVLRVNFLPTRVHFSQRLYRHAHVLFCNNHQKRPWNDCIQ